MSLLKNIRNRLSAILPGKPSDEFERGFVAGVYESFNVVKSSIDEEIVRLKKLSDSAKRK